MDLFANSMYAYALEDLNKSKDKNISFAVSQVARFVHALQRSHELALERIGKYLKGMLDKGLVLRPVEPKDVQFKIDIHANATFACGWGIELGTNPDSVKLSTAYLVEVMGCTVIWCSKLQSSIARTISTVESEYTALSVALRAAILLIDLCTSIKMI